jgi:hypothetical protein
MEKNYQNHSPLSQTELSKARQIGRLITAKKYGAGRVMAYEWLAAMPERHDVRLAELYKNPEYMGAEACELNSHCLLCVDGVPIKIIPRAKCESVVHAIQEKMDARQFGARVHTQRIESINGIKIGA